VCCPLRMQPSAPRPPAARPHRARTAATIPSSSLGFSLHRPVGQATFAGIPRMTPTGLTVRPLLRDLLRASAPWQARPRSSEPLASTWRLPPLAPVSGASTWCGLERGEARVRSDDRRARQAIHEELHDRDAVANAE